MMIEPIPITINETSLRITETSPMANNQPKAMEAPMSNRFFTFLNANTNNVRIRVMAIVMAQWLSLLICSALPTAMTGAPVIATSTFGTAFIVSSTMLSTYSTNKLLFADSIAP